MEKNKPIISILMPVYNGALYLEASIESIITQTFTQWELIVINDGSTDESGDIAKRYETKDRRILLIDNTQEKGLAGALNSGLLVAKGDYIARADADDINVPERLRVEYDYLTTHPTVDIVGSWYKTFGNNKSPKVRKHPSTSVGIAWNYLSNTYFCHPTILFRKKVLTTISQYPIVASEDFAFLSKVIHTHKGHNISKVLLNYREHGENYSSTKATAIAESVFETYKDNFAYYEGSAGLVDMFYSFHANYRISFHAFFPILKQSITIARSILKHYNLEKNIGSICILSSVVKIHFLKAILNSIIRTILGK